MAVSNKNETAFLSQKTLTFKVSVLRLFISYEVASFVAAGGNKIVLTLVAKQNIEDAAVYYKNKVSAKVAKLFIDDYRKTFKDILKTKYFRFFFQEFRGKPMKKFPFIVFYTIDEEQKIIFIKAVFNANQDDQKYKDIK